MKLDTTTFHLSPSQCRGSEDVNLVQLTDCHLFARSDGKLLGLETESSLRAVIEDIQQNTDFDFVLATGDLSQDASEASYQRMSQFLDLLKKPAFWTPGNHDCPQQMQNSIQGKNLFHHKRIITQYWQVILLDSSVKGKVHGFLTQDALDFLHNALNDKAELNTLLVLHHQPVQIGSAWLDNIGLKNNAEFMAVLALHSQVKGILWGHIHQEYQQNLSNMKLMSTPSTCVQFEPGSQDFEAGRQSPGYRRLCLKADGSIETEVIRIESQPFVVDYSIRGY